MNRLSAIFKREIASYFRSPMGYVIFAIFMAIGGLIYGLSTMAGYFNLVDELAFLKYVLIFIIPIMTMRAFSEDRRNGTEVLLFTSPASTAQIVLAKYLASLVIFLLLTATTLIHLLLTLAFGGRIDISVLGAYIGFIFLGAVFIAIGVFASALTENQIIAAVISVVIIFFLMVISAVAALLGDAVASIMNQLNFFGWFTDTQIQSVGTAITDGINWISPDARLGNIISGVFELSPIVFFVSLVEVFLFLTNRVLEKRRWSQR